VKGDLWGLLSGNQGSKREIDKPSTNPKKDKNTYLPHHATAVLGKAFIFKHGIFEPTHNLERGL